MITDDESDANERRFVTLDWGSKGVFWSLFIAIRARISVSSQLERRHGPSANNMRHNDERGAAEPPLEPGKVRITIRLDEDLLDHFGAIADRSGGKVGYQTLINSALREYVEEEREVGGDDSAYHTRGNGTK